MAIEHLDVLIVGAGVSGIAAAYNLRHRLPAKSFAILEARSDLGGTWDLFKYPGVRSDSDMYTYGFSFNPWTNSNTLASGPSIKEYLKATAKKYGIDERIRFGYRVCSASWSSKVARWTIEAEGSSGESLVVTCGFLLMCTGYYDYARGFEPEFPGRASFQGAIVHPQKWSDDVAFAGKRVVVIGSGATAVTMVPALATEAAHVTMLQRSPSYVVSMRSQERASRGLRRLVPGYFTRRLPRLKSIVVVEWWYRWCRKNPVAARAWFMKNLRKQLNAGYDVETHFSPRYSPWDQRVGVSADGDLFKAINSGSASVVTDEIDAFTERGIRLRSGAELKADLIVTATGLSMQFLSNLQVSVDGEPISIAETVSYKGVMFSGVPNLALVTGYAHASWTLKAELVCRYVCRLLSHMDKTGGVSCMPVSSKTPAEVEAVPYFGLTAPYLLRSLDQYPKQARQKPWRVERSYFRDVFSLRRGKLDDGIMQFSRKDEPVKV